MNPIRHIRDKNSVLETYRHFFVIVVLLITIVSFDSTGLLKLFENVDLTILGGGVGWLFFLFVLFFRHKAILRALNDPISILLLLFLLNVCFASYISGVLKFGQPEFGILRDLFRWGGLLIYPSLIAYSDNGMKFDNSIIKLLLAIGIVSAFFILIVQVFDLRDMLLVREGVERIGKVRAPRLFIRILVFTLFYSVVHLFSRKETNRLLYALLCSFILYIIFFEIISRRHIILIPPLILYFVFRNFNFASCLKIVSGIILIAVSLVLFIPGLYDLTSDYSLQIWDSIFNPNSNSYSSGEVRSFGLAYYWKYFKQTNFIGFGKISLLYGDTSNPITSALTEKYYRMNLSDLGVIGALYTWGVVGVLLLIGYIIKCFRMMKYIRMKGDVNQRLLAYTIELCLVFELLSLGPFWCDQTLNYVIFIIYGFLLMFCEKNIRSQTTILTDEQRCNVMF